MSAGPPSPAPAASGDGRRAATDRRSRGIFARETSVFDRGLGFYDAIYGFAITLLIANLDIPTGEAWHDLGTLFATGVLAQLGGFALSFVVIAAFWRMNVDLINRLVGVDGPVTVMNLLAAAFVILVPFTTQGISDPHSAEYALPTALYALNIALAALAQTAMFVVARARGLEAEPMRPGVYRRFLVDALATPAVFLVSVPVTMMWGADIGKLSWASLFVIAPITGGVLRRAARRSEPAG